MRQLPPLRWHHLRPLQGGDEEGCEDEDESYDTRRWSVVEKRGKSQVI